MIHRVARLQTIRVLTQCGSHGLIDSLLRRGSRERIYAAYLVRYRRALKLLPRFHSDKVLYGHITDCSARGVVGR